MKHLLNHKNNIILAIIFCMIFALLIHHYDSNTHAQNIGFDAMARIFLQIVGGLFTTCSVIEWLTNYAFDSCKVARQYLGSNAQTGRYVVEGNHIPGQIPGCEPMHSLPCNSGYYQYRFIPD